jgi:hypothetical protein
VAAKRGDRVPRPAKSTDYEIKLSSRSAERGWTDLMGSQKNALADAWDLLTKEPLTESHKCHRLRGELASVTRDGETHDRRQYELNGGARLWFNVVGRTVHIFEAHTNHPNQTK